MTENEDDRIGRLETRVRLLNGELKALEHLVEKQGDLLWITTNGPMIYDSKERQLLVTYRASKWALEYARQNNTPTKLVYISGPITGTKGYAERFNEAEYQLGLEGHHAVNPASIACALPKALDLPWEAYMEITLPLLKYCDAIYSLKGWENSSGARIEREYAARLGLELMQEGE